MQALSQSLRRAGAYTAGDQVAPYAILWTDPGRLWEGVLADLKGLVSELYVFGSYDPETRTGPAIYLRCVEARAQPHANARACGVALARIIEALYTSAREKRRVELALGGLLE